MLEKEFPILSRKINGRRLVYLDSASTTQKPRQVIEAISDFYQKHNANIHRGIYQLSLEATELYESARDKIKKFTNAKHREEIVFTGGATEAINLVAWTWGHEHIRRGDEILLTEMEHHSNLVPWQELARKKGARLRFIPLTVSSTSPAPRSRAELPSPGLGRARERSNQWWRLNLSNLDNLITKKTKLLALAHVSNVLGTINPVEKIIKAAHKKRALVLVDGAQAGGHIKIDVQKLDADFYVLSGHKMYGPTGVGVLYGKKELLEAMPPYQTGGHMIRSVDWRSATWNDLPYKFEAGTANIAAVIGLGTAVDFLSPLIHNSPNPSYPFDRLRAGLKRGIPPLKVRGGGEGLLQKHEQSLTAYSLRLLNAIPGLTIYGPQTTKDRIGVISFNVRGVPSHDLASILDERGIAIRVGHHCAMPLHEKLGIEATARVSLGLYNSKGDIDALIEGMQSAVKIFDPSLPSPGLGRDKGRGRTNSYG